MGLEPHPSFLTGELHSSAAMVYTDHSNKLSILYPGFEEERGILFQLLLSFHPSETNIFVISFSGTTEDIHLILGVQPHAAINTITNLPSVYQLDLFY